MKRLATLMAIGGLIIAGAWIGGEQIARTAPTAAVTQTPARPATPVPRMATPTARMAMPTIRMAATPERMAICTVLAEALNVRACPGTDCPAVAWLVRGQRVRLDGHHTGAWQHLAGGGWVHGAYLSCEVEHETTATFAPH